MVRRAPNRRPSDAGAQKPPKILQEGGESFLEFGSLISVSKSILLPPFGGYLKSGKNAVLTHFLDNFQLFEFKNAVNYCSMFAF